MAFKKSQDRFGKISWSKIDSNYLDVELEVFKRDDSGDFCLDQTLRLGEADFNQFMGVRKQLVIAAERFGREKRIRKADTNIVQNIVEQPKLAHNLVDIMDSAQSKQNYLSDSIVVQRSQAGEFICSSPIICEQERRREVSTNLIRE